MHPISALPLNQEAVISDLTLPQRQRQQFEDLGFTPGSTVRPLHRSPSGNLTAYAVMGSVIALRRCDASHILCDPKGGTVR
ncbi:MAG: ferrous iron transport protein A [Firmicutes bacterium]|nr:ferrous iron transport protein A [Bacillota bacterium]MBR2002383.1 ferrous iron transport protein A [Bacillota bacterium]